LVLDRNRLNTTKYVSKKAKTALIKYNKTLSPLSDPPPPHPYPDFDRIFFKTKSNSKSIFLMHDFEMYYGDRSVSYCKTNGPFHSNGK
jgi:hypothetical protein